MHVTSHIMFPRMEGDITSTHRWRDSHPLHLTCYELLDQHEACQDRLLLFVNDVSHHVVLWKSFRKDALLAQCRMQPKKVSSH